MKTVKIYSDGAARGNPDGPGGYGSIIQYVDENGLLHEKELSAGYKKTTNNRMELMGVIAALEALKYPCNVTVTSDSAYVINAFNQGWLDSWVAHGWKRNKKPLANLDLWQRLKPLADTHNITWVWVKGHAGHTENERCDVLATTAADGDNLLDDTNIGELDLNIISNDSNMEEV